MALYDYNGQYLMDEELAAMDIQKVREAKKLIETAHSSIKQVLSLANGNKGYTAAVYEDKLMSLESVLAQEAGRCDDCIQIINNAISNNQNIANEARKRKEQWNSVIHAPSPAQNVAATVVNQNKNTNAHKNTNSTSLKDKTPPPIADSLLGGLF